MAMKLSTGKIAFPIEFDNGVTEVIYFNPNDPDLFVRFSNFENKVTERLNKLEDMELSNDGTPTNKEHIEMFSKMVGIIREELDYVFGNNVSDVVFKYCSPFAIINGEYYLVQFVLAIRPEIEKCNKKAKEKAEKNLAKHIDKYRK